MKLASKSNIYIDILHYLLCLIMSVPVTLKATYCITNSIILVLSFYRGPVSWILACAKLHLQRVQFLTLAQLDCTGNHQLLITHNKSHLFTNLHLLKERDSINELSSWGSALSDPSDADTRMQWTFFQNFWRRRQPWNLRNRPKRFSSTALTNSLTTVTTYIYIYTYTAIPRTFCFRLTNWRITFVIWLWWDCPTVPSQDSRLWDFKKLHMELRSRFAVASCVPLPRWRRSNKWMHACDHLRAWEWPFHVDALPTE